ncbi:sugar ABC transporter ATP-binding protein [Ignisphaera sp. 4213-co]|uniref:Sugar ABC transporter ATP-binding protein n=1 Tax=Ignisphaera cupida TaxID=3050454 RepID=A0ABD4Z851_9CREN|nr:sugar ABC transporter ATP-binding protein [Ignisphaera sp. 4213-co]MDK6029187.1 sugar ABC transporter ATP-binding protein [Ignisphaera sp. 4213-co]
MPLLLQTRGIVKKFPGTIALKGVDFDLGVGEVHVLVGQNGAGKSTFLKIINGILTPDDGEIYVNGAKVFIDSPMKAKKLGITLTHQEATLTPNLTIAEYMFLTAKISRKSFALLRNSELAELGKKYLEFVGLSVNPMTKIKDLRAAEKQLVQVARALAEGGKVICMDEPTSALTKSEVLHLFNVIRELKKKDVSVILVTHKIDEVFEIGDRVTVLRDGEKIGTFNVSEVTHEKLVELMIGKPLVEFYEVGMAAKKKVEIQATPLLEVRNLYTTPSLPIEVPLKGLSFTLYKGEILGVTGLLGAGKTELGKALIGMEKITRGEIYIEGKRVRIGNPVDARKYGIFYLPEDRNREGLVLLLSVRDNIVLPSITSICKLHLLRDLKLEQRIADWYIKRLRIVAPSPEVRVDNLSGGNKQKVVIAKTLETRPKILILDEPTFGIDISAKMEIRRIIAELASGGYGIILLSSDIDEVLALSDKVLVLKDGVQIGLYQREELDRDKLIKLLGAKV